jgi:hypothetical protein
MRPDLLLAKCENLLCAVNQLVDDDNLGANSKNRIDQIKAKVLLFVENIQNVRKKVKPIVVPKPPYKCKNCFYEKPKVEK